MLDFLRKLKKALTVAFTLPPAGPDITFKTFFARYANEAGVPQEIRETFCAELFDARNDPQAGQRVAEKHFATYEFNWPRGTEELSQKGKKGTYKQHCRLFARKISSRTMSQHNHASKRAANPHFFPYAKIEPGPSLNLCPVHSKYFGKFLPHGDPALNSQFREHPDCKCWIQIVTRSEYDAAQKK